MIDAKVSSGNFFFLLSFCYMAAVVDMPRLHLAVNVSCSRSTTVLYFKAVLSNILTLIHQFLSSFKTVYGAVRGCVVSPWCLWPEKQTYKLLCHDPRYVIHTDVIP